jgi:hypothetical protein
MKCVLAAIIAVLVNGSSKEVVVYFHTLLHCTHTLMLYIFLCVCIENSILLILFLQNYL